MAEPAGAGTDPIHLTRDEVARLYDKSLPTVDRWIADGGDQFVVEHGGQGKPYKIDAAKLRDYLTGVAQREAEAANRRREQIAQLEISLVGGAARGDGPAGEVLTSEQRIKLWQEQLLANKLRRERGELLAVEDVERAYENRMKLVAEFLRSLPDMLAKQLGWDGTTTEACADKVEALQNGLADLMMRDLLKDG